jgi:hypothetical protein
LSNRVGIGLTSPSWFKVRLPLTAALGEMKPMDGQRFDDITRAVATGTSRRQLFRVVLGSVLGLTGAAAGTRAGSADECKQVDKACKKDSQCCAGLFCEAGSCQDESVRIACETDDDCPKFLRVECGAFRELHLVDNSCVEGFCTVSSAPPPDPCCQCEGRACIVAEGTCCLMDQVCQDKKGDYFCCTGQDYCGTDHKGGDVCLSAGRACGPNDTSACFPDEVCTSGVCCPSERACHDTCCELDCRCGGDGQCSCPLQAGVRRF